ncbi:MAG: LlaMI family restriction endonuclease [Alphaproteobacteria bacterium]|nr:LlaMI family restriction endonuclease [Alphaproteobacteria bacterium]
MEENKQKIIENFINNVKGKKFDPTGFNHRHDGAEGHWLEQKMGITANGDNEPDLLGYEMKKDTASKTTFGDWSPDLALWKKDRPYTAIPKIDRDTQFLKYFGKPNQKKGGRLSWSGEPVPTIKGYNSFGQILQIDNNENILACYSYSEDTRADKSTLIPDHFQRDDLIIAKWLKESIKTKVERKFNDKGWFKCYKNLSGIYVSIGFGPPINYSDWIKLVKTGTVFYDSGMYAGNVRPYAQWRANNNYWDELVTEKHGED